MVIVTSNAFIDSGFGVVGTATTEDVTASVVFDVEGDGDKTGEDNVTKLAVLKGRELGVSWVVGEVTELV